MLCKAFSKQTFVPHGEFFFKDDPVLESRWIDSIEAEFDVVIILLYWTRKLPVWRMMIAGEAEAVLAAADVLKQLDTRCCSELTHPGQVSEEYIPPALLCRSPCLALTTWLSESQQRHTEKNWNVRLYPEFTHQPQTIWGTACSQWRRSQPKIVVVGKPDGVRRAKAHLERQLQILCQHELQCQQYGRDAVERFGIGGGSDDFWGEVEVEEDWMKPYLYKNR